MSEHIIKKLTSPQNITLYKNGNNPNIYYYFTKNKKVFRGSTGTSDKQVAIDKMTGIFYELTHNLRRTGKKKIFNLSVIVKDFLEQKKREKLSPKTLSEYLRQSKLLIEFFKDRDIDTFGNKKDYKDYSDWRFNYYTNKKYPKKLRLGQRRIRTVGNCTVNRECRLLISLLKFAKESMNFLANKQIAPYHLLPESRRESYPTKEQYLKLKKYWAEKNLYYWYIISFVNNTGIRYPSELNNIKWKDVNLERNFLVIRNRKTKRKDLILNTPIPLVGRAREIIEILKKREAIPNGLEDFVFVNNEGIQIKNIRNAFKKSLKACDIDMSISMYSLRHLYTTRLIKRPDIPLKMISFTLGHRDTEMVEKHYGHMRSEDVIAVFKKSEDAKQEIKNKLNQKDDISKKPLNDTESYELFQKFVKMVKGSQDE